MAKNTYKSSAFRATKIGTDPADILQHLLYKYLPALVRAGHKTNDTIRTLVNISYFPTKSEKMEWEIKPIVKYTFSDTRPTKNQLQELQLKGYHLIPTIPMALLKAILCYHPTTKQSSHTYHLCQNENCEPCRKYAILYANNINILIIPCTFLRYAYLLYTHNNEEEETHMYIDQCNMGNMDINQMVEGTALVKLPQGRKINWQVLALHNSNYHQPHKTIDPSIEKWKSRIAITFPDAKIHTYPHMLNFYRNTFKTN